MPRHAQQLQDGCRVRIVGKHPHSGKEGIVKGNLYTSKIFPKCRMRLVVLDDGSESFADETRLRESKLKQTAAR